MSKRKTPPVLSIQNLSVVVDSKEVVTAFSLELQASSCHVLMGPNGSGKSSLANTLAGHPNYGVKKGKVKLLSRDLLARSPDERAQLGLLMAFQNPVEIPGLTVWQFLWQAYQRRFAEQKPRNGKKIVKAIHFIHHLESIVSDVGLSKTMLKRGVNEGFSGGEKKRLEMLQLLVLEPTVAIFDETDSGLDLDAVKIVGKVVATLQQDYDTACFVITHYQRLLSYLKPDAIHIMLDGVLVETGNTQLVKKIEKKGYRQFHL